MKRPYERIIRSVINQSARSAPVLLLVVHSTESNNMPGVTDLSNLGDWFDNPAAQCSAHVGVDAEGHSAQYVHDSRKSWACARFNSSSLNVEMIGRASQRFWPDKQLRKTARYYAYWGKKFSIPVRKGKVNATSGAILRSGIIRHSELGAAGGNHNDPGRAFPMRRLLILTRYYRLRG